MPKDQISDGADVPLADEGSDASHEPVFESFADSVPSGETDADCGQIPAELLQAQEDLEAAGAAPLEILEAFQQETAPSPTEAPEEEPAQRTTHAPVRVVSRAEWGARAPRSAAARLGTVTGVGLHYEGPNMGWPWDHDKCAGKVRAIQNFHMNTRGWIDIAYSALVCPHGSIYQGRWIGARTAANGTNDANSRYYAICGLWGVNDAFTDEAKEAYLACIEIFRGAGAGREIRGHRQFKATACPGDPVQGWINAGCPPPYHEPPPPPSPPPPSSKSLAERARANPELGRGSTGHHVKIAQALMIAHACWTEGGKVDGDFGVTTESSLGAWQTRAGLQANGRMTADVWAFMVGNPPTVQRGSTGHWARQVQALMIAHGAWTEGGRCDGNFGPGSEAALLAWQRRTGKLTADGVCGPQTWAWLVGTQ